MKLKIRMPLLALAAGMVFGSCGDDGTGPSDQDLTASTLTLEFTGDTSRIDADGSCVITLREAPASSVREASDGSKGSCVVTASWTTCPESAFSSYTLFRSETPGISLSPSSADVLCVLTDPDADAYVDDETMWATEYYYALRTSAENGQSVWSNEDSITTPDAAPVLPGGMEFATIPEGSFQMGASPSEPGFSPDERPVHIVTFNYPFEMMTTEVTQGMWAEVMVDDPAGGYGVGPDHPVYNVSWTDCQDFIVAMNSLDPSHLYRLPSESEWEYCCRAGTVTRFYWGDDPLESEISDYAWWSGNSGGTTHPVARKTANAWGLFDMSGNVWEWCNDWYQDNYKDAPSDGSSWEGPQSSLHVDRGGSWISRATGCLSDERSASAPDFSSIHLGFRLARSAV
jgi:formylglycine-generating enzyme required for sulfatase activity